MLFDSYIVWGDRPMSKYADEEIKNEPMFFNCTTDFAFEKGGPITREFLNMLAPAYREGIFDSRVHMLMPGWFPCIPGWHHDDVPRSTPNGQPNYKNPEYMACHCLALVNSDVAPTEFLIGDIRVPEPEEGRVVYEQWDTYLTASPQGEIVQAEDRPIYFNSNAFHRGTAAVKSGWRWFGRVSIKTNRKPTNEIRKQVQVYMSAVNAGW